MDQNAHKLTIKRNPGKIGKQSRYNQYNNTFFVTSNYNEHKQGH